MSGTLVFDSCLLHINISKALIQKLANERAHEAKRDKFIPLCVYHSPLAAGKKTE